MKPEHILTASIAAIADRGRQRDTSTGGMHQERSMAACVEAFNALEGTSLSERQGWVFMQVLKIARAAATAKNGQCNADDYIDGAAYAALAAEAAEEAMVRYHATRTEPPAYLKRLLDKR